MTSGATTANIKTIRKPRKSPDKKDIIEMAATHPGLTTRQMGKLLECDHSTIVRAMERYGVNKQDTDHYKEYRADILAGVQSRLLSAITPGDIEKAGLRDKVVAFGILMDKERLENGLSTQNHAVIMASAVMEAEKMSKRNTPEVTPEVTHGD
jgi:hypothetical protein